MVEFTHNYTANEIETIANNAMLTAQFTLIKKVNDFVSHGNGINSRGHNKNLAPICNIYQKKEDLNTRKVVLFSAARDSEFQDTDPNNEISGISTLAGLLKKYQEQKIEADELIIPIVLCRNRGVIHWNFLHIKKNLNTYSAICYEPKDKISTLSEHGLFYINQLVKKYFNCEYVSAPTKQLDSKTKWELNQKNMSGLCTTENIISVINNVSFNPRIQQCSSVLTNKHALLCKGPLKNYIPQPYISEQQPWGPGTEVEHIKPLETASSTSSGSSTVLSASTQSLGSSSCTSDGQIKPFTRASQAGDSSPASVTSYTLDFDEEDVFLGNLSENGSNNNSTNDTKVSESITSNLTKNTHNNFATKINRLEDSLAYQLLVQIQQEIMKKEDNWGTKLGGEDIHFSWLDKNTNEVIRRTPTYSVPHGVRLILDEIKNAQNIINNPLFPEAVSKENACKDAFIAIKKIAEERLNNPSFSVWFFRARSDKTTQFYEDILRKYDPENIIESSMKGQANKYYTIK